MKSFSSSNSKVLIIRTILFSLICCSSLVMAQTGEGISLNKNGVQQEALKVYIDYPESDNTERYIRSEIPFVSYVRDPHLAQIHVLLSDQETASGGRKYKISFIGQEEFKDQDQNLFYVSQPSDTDARTLDGLVKVVKFGLMPYISQTSVIDQVEISYDAEKIKSGEVLIHDSWDFWVFYIEFGGGLRAEESLNGYNITSTLNADRVTELWKIENKFEYAYEEENFTDDDESLKSTLRAWEGKSAIIKSISNKWSTGVFGNLYSTSYKNINLGLSLAPGIEFNIFPWSESERKMFTFGYRIGYRLLRYIQETLYDKTEQNLPFHELDIELEMIQPWGSVDIEFDASQYYQLKDTYSLKLDIEFALRISSGLAFVLESKIESIHDQIYLPKGDATRDEILLKRRQLATTYDIGLTIGLRYTFGSIYNNIINQRM